MNNFQIFSALQVGYFFAYGFLGIFLFLLGVKIYLRFKEKQRSAKAAPNHRDKNATVATADRAVNNTSHDLSSAKAMRPGKEGRVLSQVVSSTRPTEQLAKKTHTAERTVIVEEARENTEPEEPREAAVLIEPEEEVRSTVKYIGYDPINPFVQTEPLTYPYVLMPKPNNVIKFPRKGRSGRKGYTEKAFKVYLNQYFRERFQLFDDRLLIVKTQSHPYEPDFTLIDEKEGVNIFLDVEIDEPYEGINDIARRKATHYQGADANRNKAFVNRGWIVVRFAEIQVHQNPASCCRFIADVVASINPDYTVSNDLLSTRPIDPVEQWTKAAAEQWSRERYRESYLGIAQFGVTPEEPGLLPAEETALDELIEEQVVDEVSPEPISRSEFPQLTPQDILQSAINAGKYVSFRFAGSRTVVRPLEVAGTELRAFCYVKNRERTFDLHQTADPQLKNSYFTLKKNGKEVNLQQIATIVEKAITYDKFVRIHYTKSAYGAISVQETPEGNRVVVEDLKSVRTINKVQHSLDVLEKEHIAAYRLNQNHITAYCHKREEKRTFRMDRINQLEILDL
jgi:hypothetical protein